MVLFVPLRLPVVRPGTVVSKSRCLRLPILRTRRLSGTRLLSTESSARAEPASFAPSTSHDDHALRLVFDSPLFWSHMSGQERGGGTAKRRGLFQNRFLSSPEGFRQFTHESLRQCDRVVRKIVSARTVEEYMGMARDMDRLSDLLCRVIDQADFVRSTHPDRRFQAAATKAYAVMFEYMNQLNTTTVLNDQLKRAWALPEIQKAWSSEEKVAAQILMKDFAHSAIHLPESARSRFVQLSSEISQLGAEFVDNMSPEHEFLSIPTKSLAGVDKEWVRKVSSWGKVTVPSTGDSSLRILRTAEDPDVRQHVYTTRRQSCRSNIARLEKLLTRRAELARLSGFESFGHMTLSDKMAKSPEAVGQFLNALVAANRPKVQAELQALRTLKAGDGIAGTQASQIHAWDIEYYHHRLTSSMRRQLSGSGKTDGHDALSAYFSVGTVMQGLSRLFSRLYGIRLVPGSPWPGETWHSEVRRLDVVDEAGGPVGVVYCDLFARAGKVANPAHFTLRCSRQIPESELAEIGRVGEGGGAGAGADPVGIATDGMAHVVDRSDGQVYQLPTIALVCDFVRPYSRFQDGAGTASSPGGVNSDGAAAHPDGLAPALLSFRDVKTLFHEMGHAVHSLLGRTGLQNMAGTRCAVDFAELPSVLMEHFVTAPDVLGLWARHWRTDEPVPYELVRRRLALDRTAGALETEAHILLALLDQAYHSPGATERLLAGGGGDRHDGSGLFDSTAVYHDVFGEHSSVPEPAGTSYHGFFGHLVGYGATYYAYLFDRAIASHIWRTVFQGGAGSGPGLGLGSRPGVGSGSGAGSGAVSREAGEKFKNEVLRWGGSRSGWECVAGVLGRPELAEGGERGMREVGLWGIDEM